MLLAVPPCAGAASQGSFVVTKDRTVRRTVAASLPIGQVELRVAATGRAGAVLRVQAAHDRRWRVVVRNARTLRLRLPVSRRTVRLSFSARNSSVLVRIARVRPSKTKPAAPAPAAPTTTTPTPTTTAPAAPSPPAASPTPAFPSAPAFTNLVFDDEFNGPAGTAPDPSRWNYEVGGAGWGNNELESYTNRTSNAALDGQGALDIVARKETYTGTDGVTRSYTSARLDTLGHYAARYGRIEARIATPAGTGLWPAFWMLGADQPDVGYPQCGEIDVMEEVGNDLNHVYGHVHGPAGTGGATWSLGDGLDAGAPLTGSYHTYGIIWWPDNIEWTLDGTVYAHASSADVPPGGQWVFDKPQYLILNLAVGGNWPGAPTPDTAFPATLAVDWVRVWR